MPRAKKYILKIVFHLAGINKFPLSTGKNMQIRPAIFYLKFL